MILNLAGGGTTLPTLTEPGTENDLLAGKQLIDQNGNIVTGQIQSLSYQSYTPTTTEQIIGPNVYLAGAQMIQGDGNLIPENIKDGVRIFGVRGTYGGSSLPSLSSPASAADVRNGKQFINSNGEAVTGTMPTKSSQTYTPGRYSQTIASGQYLTGSQTILGDTNLISSNIRSGVSIFGVSGSYSGEGQAGYVWSGRASGSLLNISTGSVTSISQIVLTYAGLGGTVNQDIIGMVWNFGSSSAQALIGSTGLRTITISQTATGTNALRYTFSGNSLTLLPAPSSSLAWATSSTYTVAVVGYA